MLLKMDVPGRAVVKSHLLVAYFARLERYSICISPVESARLYTRNSSRLIHERVCIQPTVKFCVGLDNIRLVNVLVAPTWFPLTNIFAWDCPTVSVR